MNTTSSVDTSIVESLVDQNFFATEVPHPLRDIAVWHLLTVSEDSARMILAGWINKDPQELSVFVDESKYSLRHCINYIFDKTRNDRVSLPAKTIPSSYIKASKLFHAGLQYEKLSRLFASVYSKRASLLKEGEVYFVKYEGSVDERYAALEILGHGREESFDITGLFYNFLNDPASAETMSSKILQHTRVRLGRVVYEYSPQIVYEISQKAPQRDQILPNDFVFPWGGCFETQALINSLHIRCMYHLLAVEYTAREKGLKGGAESSLTLTIKKDRLCYDMDFLASIGEENILKFIDFLTFGVGTKTPDPALQPLIPTRSGYLLVPCAHILTSNTQRNVLALMARTMPKEFDKQSKLFETSMVEEFSRSFSRWPLLCANKEYRVGGEKEEIDMLVIDEKSKFIFVVELRWMIPPGDAREVHNRLKVCKEKVGQLQRKCEFIEKNREEVMTRAFPDCSLGVSLSTWDIGGVVVLQGYGGGLSPNPDIPVMTLDVLAMGLAKARSLKALYVWARSLSWLPQENCHFEVVIEDIEVANVVVSRPGIAPMVKPDRYAEDAAASL